MKVKEAQGISILDEELEGIVEEIAARFGPQLNCWKSNTPTSDSHRDTNRPRLIWPESENEYVNQSLMCFWRHADRDFRIKRLLCELARAREKMNNPNRKRWSIDISTRSKIKRRASRQRQEWSRKQEKHVQRSTLELGSLELPEKGSYSFRIRDYACRHKRSCKCVDKFLEAVESRLRGDWSVDKVIQGITVNFSIPDAGRGPRKRWVYKNNPHSFQDLLDAIANAKIYDMEDPRGRPFVADIHFQGWRCFIPWSGCGTVRNTT